MPEICGEKELSNIELTKKITKLTKAKKNMIKFVKDRQGHDFRYANEL